MSDTLIATLEGTPDDDVLFGTSQDDIIFGGLGIDIISAAAGDDIIAGGSNYLDPDAAVAGTLGIDESGDVIVAPGQPIEILDGGAGTDTALLSGDQSSYSLVFFGNEGTVLVDRRSDGDGVDQLTNIERLDFETELDVFGGTPMDLDLFGRAAGVGADDLESIIELYIAYFNRAPDAIGLSFWAGAYSKGTSLDQMASLFMQQDETADAFPEGMSNGAVVDIVFQNVLGREADADGRAFWVEALDSGGVDRDQFIREVILGAQADPYDGATQGFLDLQALDRLYLSNKTDIGAYFAVHRGMSDVENAASAMALFDGTSNSVWDAVDAIDAFYESALDPMDGEFTMPLVGVLDNPFDIG